MRLDKLLAHVGLGTRREVKKIIQSGRIEVDHQIIRDPSYHVDPQENLLTYAGQKIHYQKYYYIMLNKPAGIVSATEDNLFETVIDWVSSEYGHLDLFPVGRLDRDTTGLLLLTNNGQMAHQLLSPKHQVGKIYRALIQGQVNQQAIDSFAQGIDLGDFTSLPAQLTILREDPSNELTEIEVKIFEGKFHQVKRMFAALDYQVLTLHRIQMGPLRLDPNLEIGQYRPLSSSELQQLKPFGLKE